MPMHKPFREGLGTSADDNVGSECCISQLDSELSKSQAADSCRHGYKHLSTYFVSLEAARNARISGEAKETATDWHDQTQILENREMVSVSSVFICGFMHLSLRLDFA